MRNVRIFQIEWPCLGWLRLSSWLGLSFFVCLCQLSQPHDSNYRVDEEKNNEKDRYFGRSTWSNRARNRKTDRQGQQAVLDDDKYIEWLRRLLPIVPVDVREYAVVDEAAYQ